MNLLAIETTGAKASVAIIDENKQIWEEHCDETLNHLRLLMPMIERLLRKCKLKIEDIDGIAVSEGPGSFTGIRIGISTAKALAQALNLDIVCVPTLKTFAYSVPEEKRILCPIFDARRSQVYAGAYVWKNSETCMQLVADGAYVLDDFLEQIKLVMKETSSMELLFFGDGILPYKNKIEEWTNHQNGIDFGLTVSFAPEELCFQKASSVAALGYELWEKGNAQNLFQIKPVYLRQAEAQRKLEEAEAKRRTVHE
ncbi:tRNA (adenosine(37)-N6)-threonylcarbamoyltransferase complex dimerization subunit type 1 TsaB [Anaerovorax sp. IOR16]|uniref:tRNA (adenosine(37)-N6)-threonylcarbamoyltransferase complex dimerization subunit type 1 TsaB n=1 Tax=Anaerovorax sp. IOR16 TaxID=2773458 RepID=UPI0019D180DD|nr:tRNA (adenosine(37)-N6)-threonylcarbamoyltransferase complex dimerization subunit type 1 TsaB [Anaerovorax sp. IOR16]